MLQVLKYSTSKLDFVLAFFLVDFTFSYTPISLSNSLNLTLFCIEMILITSASGYLSAKVFFCSYVFI